MQDEDKRSLVRAALLLALIFIVAMLSSGCALTGGSSEGAKPKKTYIERQREDKISCIKDFLQHDVSPSDSKKICLDIYRRIGNTIE